MSDSDIGAKPADLDGYIFRRSVHMQVVLQELVRAAGELRDKRCLAIGSRNATMCRHLRAAGGSWKELVFESSVAENIKNIVGDGDVAVFDGGDSLPYEAKSFDVVIIMDGFPKHKSDYAFVEMCHKVLTPDGRLIMYVPREKKLTVINPLRSLFGIKKRVYSERRLFDVLKNGFDVMLMRSFSRFFTELVDTFVQGISMRRKDRGIIDQMQVYKVAYVFYFIAYQLDVLIFLAKGHRLIASAKRHAWRSRDAPVLSDGRSISEAVLKPLSG